MEFITWGTIIMGIIILFYFFDNTQYNQIHGKEKTDEEMAKEKNPFIK